MRNVPYITLEIPFEFKPLIADVIVPWSNLDDHIEGLRRALQSQPECSSVQAYTGSPFMRRLNHLETLSNAYFAQMPFLLSFMRKTCNRIRVVKVERDLVAHGRYTFERAGVPPTLHLRLEEEPGGLDRARFYSVAQFRMLVLELGKLLPRIRVMAFDRLPNEVAVRYWTSWGCSKHKVDQIETLLGPLRAHRHAAIVQIKENTFGVFLPPEA